MIKKLCLAGLLGLLAAGASLLMWQAGMLQPLEAATWQWRVAAFAEPVPTTGRVRIIALDQKSLDWGSRENGLSWPWPRQAYEVILSFCRRAGVKAVAFDLLFSEPSLYGVEDDQALGRAMRENGPVVLSYTLGAGKPAAVPSVSFLTIEGYADWPAGRAGSRRKVATLPVPEIAAGSSMLASISGRPDEDGVFRRAPLVSRLGDAPVPSLPLAAFLAGEKELPPLAIGNRSLQVGGRNIPLDREGMSILRFRGPSQAIPTVSAAAVIQSELLLREGGSPTLDPESFTGTYVFFGLTAPGLYDLRAMPIDGVYPGVEIHATMLDNLLAADFLKDASAVFTALLTLGLAVLAAGLILFCQRAWHSALVFVVLLPLPFLFGFVAYPRGLWLPVAVQESGVMLALVGGVLVNFATEGRKKRYIKRAFSQYLHPAVIEQLMRQPERLRLGGEKRELSILFADLQGFTTLSERLDPELLTRLLNEYLTAMTDIIMGAGGTIDKYEGDAILAFWNAPLSQADHANLAVRASIACQEKLAGLRPVFAERFGCDLFMRVGINTGTVLVGNLGSSQRFDYSILGDGVNIAARLEGVNKEFGTPILISQATRGRLAADIAVREVGRVRVVGRQEPIQVYEPLSQVVALTSEQVAAFEQGLARYYGGDFAEALECFTPLAEFDEPSARYLARCRTLLANPPLAWDGVWTMSSK